MRACFGSCALFVVVVSNGGRLLRSSRWNRCCFCKKFSGNKLFTSCGSIGISQTDKTKLVDERRIQQGFVSLTQRWSDLLFPACPLLYVNGLCSLDGVLVAGCRHCSDYSHGSNCRTDRKPLRKKDGTKGILFRAITEDCSLDQEVMLFWSFGCSFFPSDFSCFGWGFSFLHVLFWDAGHRVSSTAVPRGAAALVLLSSDRRQRLLASLQQRGLWQTGECLQLLYVYTCWTETVIML